MFIYACQKINLCSNELVRERDSMNVSYTELLLAGCILILPFLYESSQVFRFYLKLFIYYFWVSCMSVIVLPLFVLRPRSVKNLVTASTVCSPVTHLIGLRWIIRNTELLQKEQACIIVSNHQSSLDVLGMFQFWHIMGKCTVIAKRELLYAGPFGLAAWLAGLIFIPRMQSEKAKQIMHDASVHIKQEKIKLWIFPEGTRHNTNEIHPFKKGAFHLAIESQLPILPLVYSQYYFLDEKNRRFDHGKVIVTPLPPISTEGMTSKDVDRLIEQTRAAMTTAFHEASKEVIESLPKENGKASF